ncbi:hypothetical protein HUT06_36505 [Actinomadura sp. NAK00032]|uniref:hypothetical protein n=1 Tax=Actinomadura sp. NAK00032 TaxID=2742128 RepID=UPI001591F79A|nr:hypothetical protein [Actinomadura sp. NAK00032]QKW38849.1 hypothetical protein HUT06_36505 [Actinomadura sp. NAK00032]
MALRFAVENASHRAETENGDFIDEPSEDAIFMLIGDLNLSDNTFITIEPLVDDPAWYASISRLDEGGYEVEYRDARRSDHQLTTETDPDKIARDTIIWLAHRYR